VCVCVSMYVYVYDVFCYPVVNRSAQDEWSNRDDVPAFRHFPATFEYASSLYKCQGHSPIAWCHCGVRWAYIGFNAIGASSAG
jgi:hypothetical protein